VDDRRPDRSRGQYAWGTRTSGISSGNALRTCTAPWSLDSDARHGVASLLWVLAASCCHRMHHHNTMADQNVSKLGIASATLKASTRLHHHVKSKH